MTDEQPKPRTIYLHVTQIATLDHWCAWVYRAFDEPPYLVGSVLTRPDWRDVDLRMMMPDDKYDALPCDPKVLNVAFSVWGQQATGLPIDFQFQQQSAANAEFDGLRHPRGIGASGE